VYVVDGENDFSRSHFNQRKKKKEEEEDNIRLINRTEKKRRLFSCD
jgi:hypothetical protein